MRIYSQILMLLIDYKYYGKMEKTEPVQFIEVKQQKRRKLAKPSAT